MLNMVTIIGRVKSIEDNKMTIKTDNGNKGESFDVSILMTEKISESVHEYNVEIDSIVGVKGYVDGQGNVVSEKVSFLSTKNEENSDEIEEDTDIANEEEM